MDKNKTILLVEDEAVISLTLSQSVRNFGYNVIIANTGEKAVKACLENDEINFVLMDLDLGTGMSGSRAAMEILKIRNIPVIFLTAYSGRQMVESVTGIQHYGYVLKGSGDYLLKSSIDLAFRHFEALEKVKASEKNYHEIFDSSGDALFIHDGVTGALLDVNKTMLQLYGYNDKEEVLNGNSDDLGVFEEKDPARRNMDLVRYSFESGKRTFEWRARKKNGEMFWTDVSLSRIKIDGADRIIASIRDITERKHTEEILKLNEARLEAMLHLSQQNYLSDGELALMVMEECVKLTRSDIGYIAFVNEDETVMTMYAWSEKAMEICRVKDKPLEYPLESTGLWGEAVRQRRAIVTNDYDAPDEKKKGIPEGHVPIKRHMNVPIFDGDKIVAVAGVGNKQAEYDETDVRQLTLLMEGMWRIIKRSQAERKLIESEARFKSILELAPDAFLLGSPAGIIIEANKRASEISGFSYDELIGKSIQVLFSEEENKRVPFRYDLLKQGLVVHSERVLTRKDGSSVFVEMNTKMMPDGTYQSFIRDISRRKTAEDRLAAEKERLAVTLRSIGDGVITTDMFCNIMIMNKVAEDLTGWRQDEAEGKPLSAVFNIINEATRMKCGNPAEKVLETGIITELENHTLLISRDGTERIIADSGAPIQDNNSRIVGVVIVFRDMTEKIKLLDAVQQTDRLNSLGVLAGGIAHDFNNLLSGIFGYIEMARLKNTNDKSVSDYLDKAFTVFNRARDLTQQLLTFSKGGMPVCKTGNIGLLIKDSAAFALSGSNITCEYIIDEDLRLCDFDENQMSQVIDNIVINAKQAMPVGGKIVISAKNCFLKHQKNPFLKSGNYIRISISDTGIGIQPDHLKSIFDPFFTTKHQGNGLGLATCYSIIKKHDGYIDVESTPGKGSVFHILLPASEKEIAREARPSSPPGTGSGKILVMDDEVFIREISSKMLQLSGYSTVEACDGEEALSLIAEAEARGEPFDGVILDLTIPGGMGGKETLVRIRKNYPDMPVFASSGFSEDPVISNPKEFGFTGSIRKPYRKDELAAMLNGLMLKR